MKIETFACVWDALVDDPAEAADLAVRSDLLITLSNRVRSWGLSREEAARRLGLTVDDLHDVLDRTVMRWTASELTGLIAALEPPPLRPR